MNFVMSFDLDKNGTEFIVSTNTGLVSLYSNTGKRFIIQKTIKSILTNIKLIFS